MTNRDSQGRNAPRFNRERRASRMTAACAAFGANVPNGAGDGSLSGVTPGILEGEAAHAYPVLRATPTESGALLRLLDHQVHHLAMVEPESIAGRQAGN